MRDQKEIVKNHRITTRWFIGIIVLVSLAVVGYAQKGISLVSKMEAKQEILMDHFDIEDK